MKSLKAKELIKILKAEGFILSRAKGSHMIFHDPESGITVPVPLHGSREPIHIGTFMAIVKQSKIPKRRFKSK